MIIKDIAQTNYSSEDKVERKEYKVKIELTEEEKDAVRTYLSILEKLELNETYRSLSFNEDLDAIEIDAFNNKFW